MTGFLNKFKMNFANVARPLHELLKNNVEWIQGQLALYDSKKKTFISADILSYGLDSVLCQKDNGHRYPVFYAF